MSEKCHYRKSRDYSITSSARASSVGGTSSLVKKVGSRPTKFGSKKNPPRRYRVFFEVRADLAWVARSISGGGCSSRAIARQTLTQAACNDLSSTLSWKFG